MIVSKKCTGQNAEFNWLLLGVTFGIENEFEVE